MNWDWSIFAEAFPYVLQGIGYTVGLTFACYIFALVFGFAWTFLKRIPNKAVYWVVSWVTEFIRSTPPLVQLFFIFYAWPMVPHVGLTLSPFVAGILGLGIHYSTYIAEVYRSGIEGVDKGQWEASTALNLSTKQKWLKIILPQALPPTIPMLGNYLIIMFKEVPLTATIGMTGILYYTNTYGANHFRYLESLTIVAIIFLVLSYPCSILIRKLEVKMNRRFDKKAIINEMKGA